MSKITLAEVAKLAGVSTATASRVLNAAENEQSHSIKISANTKEKVLKAADELGYQQNLIASLMKKKASGVVGIILRDINDPLLAALTEKIENQLKEHDIAAVIGITASDFDVMQKQIKFMLASFFDGIIIIDYIPSDSPLLTFLRQQHTPYIIATGSFSDVATPVVRTNDLSGIKKMVKIIKQSRYERFAYLGIERRGITHRKQMFANELGSDITVIEGENVHTTLNMLIDKIESLLNNQQPLVLFCATDDLAMKAYLMLSKHGIKIPEDLGLIGFDGIYTTDEAGIKIASIKQPLDEIAVYTTNSIMAQINNEKIDPIVEIDPDFYSGETI